MKTNRVPVILSDYANTWIEKNPEYEYRFLDDDDIIDFKEMISLNILRHTKK